MLCGHADMDTTCHTEKPTQKILKVRTKEVLCTISVSDTTLLMVEEPMQDRY